MGPNGAHAVRIAAGHVAVSGAPGAGWDSEGFGGGKVLLWWGWGLG